MRPIILRRRTFYSWVQWVIGRTHCYEKLLVQMVLAQDDNWLLN